MTSRLVLTYRDNSGEKSVATFQGVSLSAANYDAQVALQGTLETAIAGLVDGTLYKRMRVASESIIGLSLPASGVQREIKYLVRYHDNVTGQQLRSELPCADLSQLVANKEFVDITAGAGLAFKNAFEAYVVSDAGNAVVVDEIIFVARNT